MPPAPTDAADADAVREALRALATGATPERTGDRERVVARAEAALADVESAADFADEGGFDRVRTVVDAADSGAADVDGAVERRSRAVLDTLAAFRAAYRRASDGRERAGADDATARDAPDHFRSTHDSHIPRAELPDDNR